MVQNLMSNIFTYFTVSLPFSSRDVSIAINNLLQMTTARWVWIRKTKDSMNQYEGRYRLSYICDDLLKGHPGRGRGGGTHTRVIHLCRITTASPSSGNLLKKIADSSQNITRKKGKLTVK